MRVTKPNWVEHTAGEKSTKTPIYSISVHPDGTRLATGGLDRQVKIWSTLPILDVEAEKDEANPKLLCTMSSHTGTVLSVRWAHHGRFLASGSDDQIIMIWGIDPDGGGRLWGSDEVNVENWKALTRLVGHVADVVDLAWSRDDSMLASVGLDSTVWIWDGTTFDRLRKLDLHQGFVKGVCWDPVGNFLATQSDDKTVKVWNTNDWSLVQSISRPFETSPQSTFFRRLSWSPDGAFIAASNAMNGPVFVAAVIDRDSWASEISFVGHENTIQVAAFNPRLFFRKGDEPVRATASCMLALGANDFSISIWRNINHKPLVVLKDVFGRDLLDMCWSNDGYNLYGSSADGSICAISFEPPEFPDLAEPEMTEKVLAEFGYQPQRQVPRGISVNPPAQISHGFGAATTSSNTVNVLQPKKGKAKTRRIDLSNGNNSHRPLQPPSANPFAAPIQGYADASTAQASTAMMFQDAHNAFASGSRHALTDADFNTSPRAGAKRKASLFAEDNDRAVRGRVMSAAQPKQIEPVEIIRAPRVAIASSSGTSSLLSRTLPIPQVQSILRATDATAVSSGTAAYLEARNASDLNGVNKVSYVQDGADQWVDFLPSAVLALAITEAFGAVACEDGSLRIYSEAGRNVANIKLGATCHDIQGNRNMLLVITSDCHVRVFDTRKNKIAFPSTSFSHLLDGTVTGQQQQVDILECTIRPNGVPVIITSEPTAYAYDRDLSEWVVIASKWWSDGSPLSIATPILTGPLADIEKLVSGNKHTPQARTNVEWRKEAMSTNHYENKLRATILLGSKEEYQFWLIKYVEYLGAEGFVSRAEELLNELVGPLYHPTSTTSTWPSTIMGMRKRDVAREVVHALKGTKCAELARGYGEILRRIEIDGEREKW